VFDYDLANQDDLCGELMCVCVCLCTCAPVRVETVGCFSNLWYIPNNFDDAGTAILDLALAVEAGEDGYEFEFPLLLDGKPAGTIAVCLRFRVRGGVPPSLRLIRCLDCSMMTS